MTIPKSTEFGHFKHAPSLLSDYFAKKYWVGVLCAGALGTICGAFCVAALPAYSGSPALLQEAVSLPSGPGWHEIPNTKLSSACSNESPVRAASGCAAVISAWSGGVADTKRNRLIIWGGGHSDYFGNEIYALDLNSLMLKRLNQPNIPPGLCGPATEDGTAPSARHTYNGLAYISDLDLMYVVGGGIACGHGMETNDTWVLNLETLQWARKDPTIGGPLSGLYDGKFAAYDPVGKRVYANDASNFWSYDIKTNTYANLGAGSVTVGGLTGEIDPRRRLFIVFGRSSAYALDLRTRKLKNWGSSTRGCSALLNSDYPGLAYDSSRGLMVGWVGGSTVYEFNPDTKTCQPVSWPIGPAAAQANGTYGRFRYFPSLDVFVLVNDWQQNAWILRLDSGAGSSLPTVVSSTSGKAKKELGPGTSQQRNETPPAPSHEDRQELAYANFRERCAAGGVLVCEGFDDPSLFQPAIYPGSGLYPAGSGLFKGTMDSTVVASGKGALRFEIDPYTSANSAGFWRQIFGKSFGPHSTFYVQFRFRVSPEMLTQNWGDPVGNTSWKVAIFHYLSKTCGSVEITTQNNYLYGIPILYTDCGSRSMYTNGGNPPFLKQQGETSSSGYNCKFGTDYHKDPNCLRFVPNTWMTFYYQISIGDWGKPNSYIQAWAALPGEPYKQWVNMPNFVLDLDTPGHYYDSIDLLNYMTGKDPKANHSVGYTWYDELIVSTKPIAVPKY